MNTITKEKREELTTKIQPLLQQVQHWRTTRQKNERMPESLWIAAAELARVYGVSPVQRTLRIDYRGLEYRAFGVCKSSPKTQVSAPTFVELPTLAPAPRRAEQIIELEDGTGRRMILKVCGGNLNELVPLAQAFWKPTA